MAFYKDNENGDYLFNALAPLYFYKEYISSYGYKLKISDVNFITKLSKSFILIELFFIVLLLIYNTKIHYFNVTEFYLFVITVILIMFIFIGIFMIRKDHKYSNILKNNLLLYNSLYIYVLFALSFFIASLIFLKLKMFGFEHAYFFVLIFLIIALHFIMQIFIVLKMMKARKYKN